MSAPNSSLEYSSNFFLFSAMTFFALSFNFTTVSESSSSLKIILPLSINPLLSNIPANVFVKTDLPEPDSPTIPRVFPGSKLKLIPFTACTSPLSVLKVVCRSLTSKIYLLSILRSSYLLSFGSKASRKPSPRRFNARTIRQMVNAGKINLSG